MTDSKMREWASLGVKRGARSSGLRFWSGASNRDEDGCWCDAGWCKGVNRRVPAGAPPLGAWNCTWAAPPPPPWGISPTSCAVRGAGRKLSNTGLRMRPSLAYLAEEKHCCSLRGCDVQRKVGCLRMEQMRLSCDLESTEGPGRKGVTG